MKKKFKKEIKWLFVIYVEPQILKKNAHTWTCRGCGSLDRQRAFKYALEHKHYLAKTTDNSMRVLHFAPEQCTTGFLQPIFGSGYIAADANPDRYKFVKALRLTLPDSLDIFPDEYFDLILHNHVLEHIPGDWRAHIAAFHMILKPGGQMIFTAPVTNKHKTIQGGELMPYDERAKLFGHGDHLKLFVTDFVQTFDCFNCDFEVIAPPLIDNENIHYWRNHVYCYTKK